MFIKKYHEKWQTVLIFIVFGSDLMGVGYFRERYLWENLLLTRHFFLTRRRIFALKFTGKKNYQSYFVTNFVNLVFFTKILFSENYTIQILWRQDFGLFLDNWADVSYSNAWRLGLSHDLGVIAIGNGSKQSEVVDFRTWLFLQLEIFYLAFLSSYS